MDVMPVVGRIGGAPSGAGLALVLGTFTEHLLSARLCGHSRKPGRPGPVLVGCTWLGILCPASLPTPPSEPHSGLPAPVFTGDVDTGGSAVSWKEHSVGRAEFPPWVCSHCVV